MVDDVELHIAVGQSMRFSEIQPLWDLAQSPPSILIRVARRKGKIAGDEMKLRGMRAKMLQNRSHRMPEFIVVPVSGYV